MKLAKILVVDDEPTVARIVALVLEREEEFDVRVETRSLHAVSAAREFRPDLVLLDVDMPEMDGGCIAAEMGADALLREVPIIFFSGLITQNEAGKQRTGRTVAWHLSKPVNPALLVQTVRRVLAEQGAMAGAR